MAEAWASWNKVSQKGDAPDSNRIGRGCTPGWSMSTSIRLIPSCFGLSGEVRARTKMKSQSIASLVQIFAPFST
ncbi:MAG: hypothetical protein CMQ24_19415 [Gammaproteobacteria bacterium]|nr:hypothetical protein [Gammaproteobacteria bacterium]